MKIFARIISALKRRPTLASGLAGILAGLVALSWLEGRQAAMIRGSHPKKVVCARLNIAEGKIISSADVVVRSVPQMFAEKNAFTEISSVVGKVSKISITVNSQISEQKVSAVSDESFASALIPLGLKAVVVSGERVRDYSKILRAGDLVDVVSVSKLGGRSGHAEPISENAIVLSSGRRGSLGSNPTSGVVSANEMFLESHPVILAVSESDALKINAAMSEGDVYLNLSVDPAKQISF